MGVDDKELAQHLQWSFYQQGWFNIRGENVPTPFITLFEEEIVGPW